MSETESVKNALPHLHRRVKKVATIDWQAAAVIVFIIAGLIGWGISVETRIAQHAGVETLSGRIKNIEDLMTPMLVDWRVQAELKKYGVIIPKKFDIGSLSLSGTDKSNPEKVKEAAKKWVEKKTEEERLRIEEESKRWVEDRVRTPRSEK